MLLPTTSRALIDSASDLLLVNRPESRTCLQILLYSLPAAVVIDELVLTDDYSSYNFCDSLPFVVLINNLYRLNRSMGSRDRFHRRVRRACCCQFLPTVSSRSKHCSVRRRLLACSIFMFREWICSLIDIDYYANKIIATTSTERLFLVLSPTF